MILNVRKIVEIEPDGNIKTEELPQKKNNSYKEQKDEKNRKQRRPPKPIKTPNLSPAQIRNMSHQDIQNYLKNKERSNGR